MKQTIYTKLHEAKEVAAPEIKAKLERMEKLPHYILDSMFAPGADFWNQNNMTDKIENSLAVLHKIGKMSLPKKEIFVELWGSSKEQMRQRIFLTCTKQHEDNDIFSIVLIVYDTHRGFCSKTVELHLRWFDTSVASYADIEETAGRGFDLLYVNSEEERENVELNEIVIHMMCMLSLVVMINNLKGIGKEVIHTDKINKVRQKANKSRINSHTVIRIGHVYDRSGKKTSIGHSGRQIAMHMREAHTQMQPHGAAWIKANPEEAAKPFNTDTHHLVFKEACLVNYNPGDELPIPKPKVVKW